MKKIIALVLSAAMLFTCLFTGTLTAFAVEEQAVGRITSQLRETFADDIKGEWSNETDGHLGIPVQLTTFVRDSATSCGVTILYAVGHMEERIGTDSDEDIIDDMLNEGYAVTVLDYLDNPKAIGNELGWSAHNIFSGEFKSQKYTSGYTRKKLDNMYFVPAGCRVSREIYYYSLDEMALNGTNEYILWLWNTHYAGENGVEKDAQGNDLPSAETIYDLIKPDGSPMDFDLRMDIVYPANPKEDATVPVYALASSSEERTGSFKNVKRPYFTTALLQGYAAVVYDHEYIPMSRNDHYGYYGYYGLKYSSFTLGSTNANAVHSAAIRRIRYLADDYGYDGDYIITWGFSKSGLGPAILANTKHEEMGEMLDFGEYVPEGKDPAGYQGEQPWLYYEGTNEPISSNVTVAYAGAGAGIGQYRESLMTEDSVPIVSSIGTADTTGSFYTYIPAAKKYFDSHPEVESDFVIAEGLDHNPAFGYDSVKQIEMFNEIWGWLDNHIRAAYSETSPEVMWVTPTSNVLYDALEEPVVIKFSRAMDEQSVKENVKVIRLSDGAEIDGTWEVWHGGTTFRFSSPFIINASSYRVVISAETKAEDGVKLGTDYAKVFTISGDQLLTPSADATVSSANPDTNYGNDSFVKSESAPGGINNGYLSFAKDGGFADTTKALLLLNRATEEDGDVKIYKTGAFDENTITYNNAPAKGELVGSEVVDTSITAIDVTDYVAGNTSDTVNFVLDSTAKEVYLDYDFENMEASDLVYEVDYRWGAGSATLSIVDQGKDGGSCAYVTDRFQNGNRFKFFNSIGTMELTQDDIGKKYKAGFWIKVESDTNVTVGMYAKLGTVGYNTQAYAVEANKWTYIEYQVTIDETLIANNAAAITVIPGEKYNYYLDDFKSELVAGGITFASKEYEGETQHLNATLVLYTPEQSNVTGTAAVIGSGDKADTILDEELSAAGIPEENISQTTKGYIKFPISEFDTTSDTITLDFTARSSGTAKFSVYGVLADDSRFAENFTTGITWNTALANDIDGNGVDEAKTVLIDSVSVTGQQEVSLDVKDYVKTMADAGYSAVTFIIVKDNNDSFSKVTFENMTSYEAYVKNAAMDGYNIGVTADPTNSENSVLYIEKSGINGGTNSGYSQTVSLTGLIKSDDTFTESDIGKNYRVSFKLYSKTNENVTSIGNYCNIAAVGASTSSSVTAGITRNVSSTKVEQWNNVSFDFTVTSDLVSKNTTAIIIASGWSASMLYIDDIVVEEKVGDLEIVLTAGESKVNFEGISDYTDIVRSSELTSDYATGITADPTDSTNNVFFFEKSGTSSNPSGYAQSISFTGLISATDKYTADDVGKTFTVTYRHYNELASGGTSGILGTIGRAGSNQYMITTGATRYVDGALSENYGTYGKANNRWYDVRYEIVVTEEMVGNDCAIIVAAGAAITKIYIDDLEVTVEGVEQEQISPPALTFTKDGTASASVYSSAVAVSGVAKDSALGEQAGSVNIIKTAKGVENNLRKTYVSFDKTGYYHVTNAYLNFAVENPVKGSELKIYVLNKEVDVNGITWNNVYGNDKALNGIQAGAVYGGAPVATIVLTDETQYRVDVSDAVAEYENNDSVALAITAGDTTAKTVISDITLDIASAMYFEDEVKTEIYSSAVNGDDAVIAVDSTYRVDYGIEKVEFFIDGEEAAGEVVINGQITKVKTENLGSGEHTVYAVVTYADGTSVTSNQATFTVEGPDFIYGDCNADGNVNTTDLAALKLHLAGSGEVTEGADCNGSGAIDTTDLAQLKLFLAGAGKLGPQ